MPSKASQLEEREAVRSLEGQRNVQNSELLELPIARVHPVEAGRPLDPEATQGKAGQLRSTKAPVAKEGGAAARSK